MSDEDAPEAFQLIFELPDYNATKRHTAGGARGQINIDEATIAAWEAMVTYATRNKLTKFAAAVVIVATHSDGDALLEPIRVRSWKEPKLKKLNS
jgi:hypothetical protein